MIFYSMLDFNANASEQHEAAHKLLSSSLKNLYGIEKYSLGYGEHGKPFLNEHPEIFFNLSHCKGLVVCGISDREIGVDAEHIRPYKGNAGKRIFSETEEKIVLESSKPSEMFFRIWTLKESLGKAFGTGIFYNKKYEFSFEKDSPVCPICSGKIFTQKIIREKWVISVCSSYDETDFINTDIV